MRDDVDIFLNSLHDRAPKTRDTYRKILNAFFSGTEYMGEVKDLLTSPMDYSEKVARLKAGQRAEVASYGRWAVVFSHLGSYQSSGARALISLGADMAAVGGEEKGEVRVSMRSTNEFSVLTGVHLGDLASQLGTEFSGSGSGHPTAAGVNCSGSLEAFRKRFFEVVKGKLAQQQVL